MTSSPDTCTLTVTSHGKRDSYITSCGEKFTDAVEMRAYYEYESYCGKCNKEVIYKRAD